MRRSVMGETTEGATPGTPSTGTVVPTGRLLFLSPDELRPNPANPRLLFDEQPLLDLKENIRTHGVLVPITVYPVPAQPDKYAILDGERRYRCCRELQDEGHGVRIPANVVEPPSTVAGMLWMFNIHNYRQPWELMPTALSLGFLVEQLGETDERKLASLTGLDEKQVQRCLTLLAYPERYQKLSLDADPTTRIPSNFWIELDPVLNLCEKHLPDLVGRLGRDGIIDRLVDKYRRKKVTSVIHFRRILEAYEVAESMRTRVLARLVEFIEEPTLETRAAFDEFIAESRRVQTALSACSAFLDQIAKAKLDNIVDERDALIVALRQVRLVTDELLDRLRQTEEPPPDHAEDNE
jgi:ParB family chromosome partitioning protein